MGFAMSASFRWRIKFTAYITAKASMALTPRRSVSAFMRSRSPPTTTMTPPKPSRAANLALGPIRSPKNGDAKKSAMMGATKVSPMACASGTRVKPKKKQYIMTAVRAERPTCNLKASGLGCCGRDGKYNIAANNAPIALRQYIAL